VKVNMQALSSVLLSPWSDMTKHPGPRVHVLYSNPESRAASGNELNANNTQRFSTMVVQS